MILVVARTARQSKKIGKEILWGIMDNQEVWYDFHGGFQPSKGQSLNVRIEDEQGKDGKTYKHAHLIEPPPRPGFPNDTQQAQPPRLAPTTHPTPMDNGYLAAVPGPSSYADFKKAEAQAGMAPKPKIKWDNWIVLARAANELARDLEDGMADAYARMKFVNTTLMEYAKGNLELPTEAGPAEREPGDDADAYADPNKTIPWGN